MEHRHNYLELALCTSDVDFCRLFEIGSAKVCSVPMSKLIFGRSQMNSACILDDRGSFCATVVKMRSFVGGRGGGETGRSSFIGNDSETARTVAFGDSDENMVSP